MLPVDRREVQILHRVFLPSTHTVPFFDIDLVQQKPLIHPELRVTHDHLSLQLELDHRNRLVHFLIQHGVTHIVLILPVIQLKAGAGILVVSAHGKSGERHQIDAVSVL